MISSTTLLTRIDELSQLLHEKTGVSGATCGDRLRRARPQLPRRLRGMTRVIADVERDLDNPRLYPTLAVGQCEKAIAELTTHLNNIDLADRRKGWWLGVLGGVAFNLLAATVLLIALLRYFGQI